ncbi:hypothetical protein ABZ839_26260 [Streptomyces cellulosae]
MDLQSIVKQEQKQEISEFSILPGALWLLHISASGLATLPPQCDVGSDIESAFEFARVLINDSGGIPVNVLDSPPDYVDVHNEQVTEEWLERLQGERMKVPGWREYNSRYVAKSDYSEISLKDAARASMEMLMADDWRWDSVYPFVCELRKLPR